MLKSLLSKLAPQLLLYGVLAAGGYYIVAKIEALGSMRAELRQIEAENRALRTSFNALSATLEAREVAREGLRSSFVALREDLRGLQDACLDQPLPAAVIEWLQMGATYTAGGDPGASDRTD